jgi:hypothetical protein
MIPSPSSKAMLSINVGCHGRIGRVPARTCTCEPSSKATKNNTAHWNRAVDVFVNTTSTPTRQQVCAQSDGVIVARESAGGDAWAWVMSSGYPWHAATAAPSDPRRPRCLASGRKKKGRRGACRNRGGNQFSRLLSIARKPLTSLLLR